MKSDDYLRAYIAATNGSAPDPWLPTLRRWLQDHTDALSEEQRGQMRAADQRLLAQAREEADAGMAVDLWDVLSYCGYPAEGPTRVD